MLLTLSLLLLGLIIIYFGAEWLVGSSVSLATRLGVPPLVVGLTIVAYGTSAPELVVAVQAALMGRPDLVLGNVLGSNLGNLGIILGLTALFCPFYVERLKVAKQYAWVFAFTLSLFALGYFGFFQLAGMALVLAAFAYTFVAFWTSKSSELDELVGEVEAVAPKAQSLSWTLLVLLAGMLMLAVGGNLFLRSAVDLAQILGLSEVIIGLTVVAFATTTPELFTSVLAARREQPEIALGNILGSTIFNASAIIGTATLIRAPQSPFSENWFQLSGLLGMTLLVAIFLFVGSGRMGRRKGGALVALHMSILAVSFLLI